MSLRTRLILAFFTLSVVPLAAVTFYTYTTNVAALRQAAEREADLLASELGHRMELVTAQLSERVEHLMDVAELQAAAEAAQQEAAARTSTAATPTAPVTTTTPVTVVSTSNPAALNEYVARSLGEAAMLLNNVQLQNMRGGGRGGRGGPPPPGAPPQVARVSPPSRTTSIGPVPAVPAGPPRPLETQTPTPTPTPTTSGAATARGAATTPPMASVTPAASGQAGATMPPGSRGDRTGSRSGDRGGDRFGRPMPTPAPVPEVPRAPGAPATPVTPPVMSQVDASGKLTIDMGPIRREMFREILPEGRSENLTPEERQRVAAEINQRMLGIAQGIQIGAAEVQKRAEAAQREAAAKAAEAAKAEKANPSAAPKAVVVSDLKRRSSLSGSRIDVKLERNGEVVRQMNAEINLPNVLATVFSTTTSERGEVPFAVAKDGLIYTRTEADKVRVASFGAVANADGPATARLNDWVIVTTQDKSGSGLRLGIARPVSDSLATLRIASARNAGLGLLFIVIALVGIVPLSTRLTSNLATLGAAVGRIAQGDYRRARAGEGERRSRPVGRGLQPDGRRRRDASAHGRRAGAHSTRAGARPPDPERDAAARAAQPRPDGGERRVRARAGSRRRLLQLLRARQRPGRAARGRRVGQGRRRGAPHGQHPGVAPHSPAPRPGSRGR